MKDWIEGESVDVILSPIDLDIYPSRSVNLRIFNLRWSCLKVEMRLLANLRKHYSRLSHVDESTTVDSLQPDFKHAIEF